jgi:UDP-glucose 4-epimerase
MRRALVTGGAGFIGSTLADALLDRGCAVIVLDDLSTGRWENLSGALNRGAQLIVGSVTDERAVARALGHGPDTVFHLAAQIDVRRAVADPARDALVNLVGAITTLAAAQLAGVRRFVLASTGGAIYGDARTIPTPETEPPRPLSPYAASKRAAEDYLELYRALHGLSTLSLRLANVYGPRQDARGEAGVIARFCAADGPVAVFGDGTQTRDFVYVDDVVEAFVAGGRSDVTGRLNISTGRETSVLELAERLRRPVAFAPERAGEVRRSCLDPSAARRELGWSARTSLQDGLTSTVAAMRRATAASA